MSNKYYENLKNNPKKWGKEKEKRNIRSKLWRQETREKINHAKMEKGCSICGYRSFVVALDFHHLNPNEKGNSINGMAKAHGWKDIETEMSKCVVLCSNCHIALHAGLVKLS